MDAKRGAGAVMTIAGMLLFLYALVAGALRGHIGSKAAWTPDAVAVIVGWFLIMIGPALYFGSTPARILKEVESKRG